jgi:hypothetical protein
LIVSFAEPKVTVAQKVAWQTIIRSAGGPRRLNQVLTVAQLPFPPMYKAVFQNSKAALIFAAMTVVSAVVMVGSPEDKGVLNEAADRFGEQRENVVEEAKAFAESQSVADVPSDPEAGWGSSRKSVFGDYNSEESIETDFYAPAPAPGQSTKPAGQPAARIPGPQPVVADNEGIPVPGTDDAEPVRGAPVITSRRMTIEPK